MFQILWRIPLIVFFEFYLMLVFSAPKKKKKKTLDIGVPKALIVEIHLGQVASPKIRIGLKTEY